MMHFMGQCESTKDTRMKAEDATVGTAVFLIGLGLLWLSDIAFFPGILLVFGLVGLVSSLVTREIVDGLQTVLWMGGLYVMFAYDLWWPGIVILIGLSMLLGAFDPDESEDGRKKKKRTLDGPIDVDDDLQDYR